MVNCEAGCGEKPKIAPVHQAISEIFTSGPPVLGKTTVSARLQDVAGLVRTRERWRWEWHTEFSGTAGTDGGKMERVTG